MNDDRLTLSQCWKRLTELGDKKPAWTMAKANTNRRGNYCDFWSKDNQLYRLTSIGRGELYSVRKLT